MQLPRPIGEVLQGLNRTLLQSQALVEIDDGLGATQGGNQRCRTNCKTKSESPKAPALRKGEEFNAALPPVRSLLQRGRLSIQGEIHIGIVVSDHHVVPSCDRRDAIEILLIPHPG